MRLGGYYTAEETSQLEKLAGILDQNGLSAIQMPGSFRDWTEDKCSEYGEKCRELDILPGEAGMWDNIMGPDLETRNERIAILRKMLKNAEAAGCPCVVVSSVFGRCRNQLRWRR